MKPSTVCFAAAAVAVGVGVVLAKARRPGLGDADMLLPPPGRTITASGQVLGDLGLETRHIDVYDAAPSQYRSRPRNDFVPGLGAYKQGDRKIENDTVYYFIRGGYTRDKSGPRRIPDRWEVDKAATAALRAKKAEEEAARVAAIAQQKVNETLLAIQKRAEEEMAAQQRAEMTLKHQTETTNYERTKQAYDAVQAAKEQASMSAPTSDTGYGRTSDDSGYGSTQQVYDDPPRKTKGDISSRPFPVAVSSVQTPSALMLPEEAPAARPSGDSKVGLVVGGGVLAAIAAALAT